MDNETEKNLDRNIRDIFEYIPSGGIAVLYFLVDSDRYGRGKDIPEWVRDILLDQLVRRIAAAHKPEYTEFAQMVVNMEQRQLVTDIIAIRDFCNDFEMAWPESGEENQQ